MADSLAFTVAAEPIAQPRQRHRIAGKGRKQFVQSYVPADHEVHGFKAAVKKAALEAGGAVAEGPVAVSLAFLLPFPESARRKTKPTPRRRHTGKPDADNLAKSVLDALTGLLWHDDAQVAELTVSKFVAADHEAPGVAVEVRALALEAALKLFPDEGEVA